MSIPLLHFLASLVLLLALGLWIRSRGRATVRLGTTPGTSGIDIAKLAMRIVVSLAILGTALYIILSGEYDDGSKEWAFGSAGAVAGNWLKMG